MEHDDEDETEEPRAATRATERGRGRVRTSATSEFRRGGQDAEDAEQRPTTKKRKREDFSPSPTLEGSADQDAEDEEPRAAPRLSRRGTRQDEDVVHL